MQHQSITEAMSTQELVFSLEHSNCDDTICDDDGKMSWRDCLVTLLQVVSAVGFCGVIHFVAM